MIALSLPERERLAKLLAMLGSSHAGERDAAGLAAHRLLNERGTTWADALGISTRTPNALTRPVGWQGVVRRCRERNRALTPWERGFLSELDRLPRLSLKQAAALQKIADRVLSVAGPREAQP